MHAEVEPQRTKPDIRFYRIKTIALLWILLALLSLLPLTAWLDTSFPLFSFLWLLVPLISLIKTQDAARIGIRPIPWKQFAKYGAINLALLSLTMALFEPWSHTYQTLLNTVFASKPMDLTFVWVTQYPGTLGLVGMFLFSGLVTLFGEELFFRGWLLQLLLKRMSPTWAILIQALLFSIPQSMVALFFQPLQAALYIVIYSWFAIGVIGGWSAWRTGSIFPSLATAAIMNLILTIMLH